MVNWHDPAAELFSAHVAVYVVDMTSGAYLWEFFTCFCFDWQYFAGRRPFRWTLIPYLVARYASAVTFVLYGYTANVFRPIDNCTAWWKAIFAFGHLFLAASSFLLVVRVIAISGNKRWISVMLGAFWLAEAGTSIHSVVTVEGEYIPDILACVASNAIVTRPYMLVSFVLHLACLALVLFLLLRWHGAGLWGLLVSQGIIYFVVSVLAHGSNVVFLFMDLNNGINLCVQFPAATAIMICATRMYRGLVTYARPDSAQMDTDGFVLTTPGIHGPCAPARRPHARRGIFMPQSFAAYSTTDEPDGSSEDKAGTLIGDTSQSSDVTKV